VATHPATGETVWFDGLPQNIVYGDGEPVEDEVITLIKRVCTTRRGCVSRGSARMC
jgi:hypothetical protein